jgi:hypothetical protein
MAQRNMSTDIAPFTGSGVNVFNSFTVAFFTTNACLLVHVLGDGEVRAHIHGFLELGAVTERAVEEESLPFNAREGGGDGVYGDEKVVKQICGRGVTVRDRESLSVTTGK